MMPNRNGVGTRESAATMQIIASGSSPESIRTQAVTTASGSALSLGPRPGE
jgi:hypothetical protein